MRSTEAATPRADRRASPAWLAWTAAAWAAVLWHGLIDQHIGLLGHSSGSMSLHQAAAASSFAAVLAWWMWMAARAAAGDSEAVRATMWVVVAFGALYHGLVALASSPPPSDAYPYQDLAHVAALVCGVGAARALWRAAGWGAPGRVTMVSVGVLVLNAAVRGSLMAINVAG